MKALISIKKIVAVICITFALPMSLTFVFYHLTADSLSCNDIFHLVQGNEAALRKMSERILARDISEENAVTDLGIRGI